MIRLSTSPPRHFKPDPFPYHHELTLEINALSHQGKGIGRYKDWVVMVAYAVPGDRIKARIFRNHSNYSEADLIAVLESSPDRVAPRCELFGECGGCQYQHIDYGVQLKWKQQHVRESLERLAGLKCEVSAVRTSGRAYAYRSKLTPHFRQSPKRHPDTAVGFEHSQSRRIVDVPYCPIATDALNEVLPKAREELRNGQLPFKKGGTLLLRDCIEGVVSDPNAIVSSRIGEWVFQFQAGEFFQNNPFILADLVDYVVQQAADEGLKTLIDAYCGVGVFSLAASRHFDHCFGIEINANAIHWANANAVINKVDNCTFRLGKAESIFEGLVCNGHEASLIIDPPRRGCDEAFLQQVFAFSPQKVVYVSCAPDTQARDLAHFLAKGYEASSVQPFDLFPQTRHIENVVVLQRKGF